MEEYISQPVQLGKGWFQGITPFTSDKIQHFQQKKIIYAVSNKNIEEYEIVNITNKIELKQNVLVFQYILSHRTLCEIMN